MSSARITYAPHTDATAGAEVSALTNAYRFILDSSAEKKGARPGAPDARKENLHDSGNTSIPRAS